MTVWKRWVQQPQSLFLRKALFQVHLWTGIGLGLYMAAVSVSGSAIVYRNEIYRAFDGKAVIVTPSGERMAPREVVDVARTLFPNHEVMRFWENAQNPDQAVEVTIERDGVQETRIFDPYTAEDLGNAIPLVIRVTSWFIELHTDLLAGPTGRWINGIGAAFLVLLTLTGIVIWWPGIRNWPRSLTLHWSAGWKRFNWDLHSAIGFWTFAFVLMWAVTGVHVSIPWLFEAGVNYLYGTPGPAAATPAAQGAAVPVFQTVAQTAPQNTEPAGQAGPRGNGQGQQGEGPGQRGGPGGGAVGQRGGRQRTPPPPPRLGDTILRWSVRLHFGNFGGQTVKVLWVIFGLVPLVLFATGAVMWWNRVVRRSLKA